jgi:hypothetical protein
MNKKITAIGLTAGLLVGAGAGFLLESSGSAGASSNTISTVVATSGTADTSTTGDSVLPSVDGTRDSGGDAEHTARLQSVLQPLVDDGTLTQAQADKVVAALQAAGPVGGGHMGGGEGPGHGGRGPGGGLGRGAGLDSVATLLGVTGDELHTALDGGQTLAQIAVAHGKTAQDVIDVLVADVTAHFADEVAAGEHTQAEADQKIADFTQHITDAVNNGGPIHGGPDGGRHNDGGAPTTSTGA